MSQKIHFIAIGGSVMHGLAIDLHSQGNQVTGSDDEIFSPSKEKLEKHGLLPKGTGWYPEKITKDLDVIILGMHARADNPELIKAQELGLKIYTFPEYIYQTAQNKQRIVIAGSHGKTTITSIILHVLKSNNREFDYMVGADLEGFEQRVHLSQSAPIIILEGDEYFSSALDATPKFLHYHHHIAVISGIAWDHINVFPTSDEYLASFEKLAEQSPKSGVLIYSQDDPLASVVGRNEREDVLALGYEVHPHVIKEGKTLLLTPSDEEIEISLFGEHNMKNIAAAKLVCSRLGLQEKDFYNAIATFKGANNRLAKVVENEDLIVFKDFAHAPSKLEATSNAVKEQFSDRELVACLELHTYSSLNKNFLGQYKHKFNSADLAIIYYNPQTIEHKRLESIDPEEIQESFGHRNLRVFNDIQQLEVFLRALSWKNKVLLMMSSGNFDNLDLETLSQELINN